jgi:GDP-mannose transporter
MSDFKLDVVLGQDFPEPGFRPEKGKTISGAEKIIAAVYKIFSVNFAGRRAKSDG